MDKFSSWKIIKARYVFISSKLNKMRVLAIKNTFIRLSKKTSRRINSIINKYKELLLDFQLY